MCCFLAPAAVAVITTSFRKKIPEKYHIERLNTMLWGGVLMLFVDHLITGEVVLYPPFLSAMQNSADTTIMIREIFTVGGAMTAVILFAWVTSVFFSNKKELKKQKIAVSF